MYSAPGGLYSGSHGPYLQVFTLVGNHLPFSGGGVEKRVKKRVKRREWRYVLSYKAEACTYILKRGTSALNIEEWATSVDQQHSEESGN